MDPIFAVVVVIVVGLLVWLALTFVPMPPVFQQIVLAVAVIGVVLWLLDGFGIFHLSQHLHK